jgi:hypothetical protein
MGSNKQQKVTLNIKEKIDDDNLDLSVCSLNTIDLVPIKQIVSIKLEITCIKIYI